MALHSASPGIAKQITAPESGTTYRGFITLEETTMAFTSGPNSFGSRTYPAGFMFPCQVDSIVSISGAIGVFVLEFY